MAIFYNQGETKKRPGVYQLHTNRGNYTESAATDGICAIPVRASWGPLGQVLTNHNTKDLTDNYGSGTYSNAYTVSAAQELMNGGASTVYTYRLGTGGAAASLSLQEALVVTAKYVGAMPMAIAIQAKLSDASMKQLLVYAGTQIVETWEFEADGQNEGTNLIAAVASSNYIVVTTTSTAPATVNAVAVASGSLTGGQDPTVQNSDYTNAFEALEPYYYNTISLDVNDDENLTLSLLLQAYLDNAYTYGKLGIAVVGEPTTVAFNTRATHAKAFNDAKVVYLGGGYKAGTVTKDGALAICYTAGVIASTPSNQGITHTVVQGATDLLETLTYAQYDLAVDNGMLLLSMAPDGSIWYDTGIDTLTTPDADQDAGWEKIRRVKVRFELIDRIDRVLAPKVGKVSADTDGISDIIQSAQRILNTMANSEGKIRPGAQIFEDPNNPATGDSAWFIIQADDIDSLEKIYLNYQFRYSQNV